MNGSLRTEEAPNLFDARGCIGLICLTTEAGFHRHDERKIKMRIMRCEGGGRCAWICCEARLRARRSDGIEGPLMTLWNLNVNGNRLAASCCISWRP